jgi:hypothetical protein
LAIVLGVSWLARAAFVLAIGDAHSLDVEYWQGALAAQDEGTNPYETGVLNWPPLWLMVIVGVDFAAGSVDVAFWTALRVYLVFAESALLVVLYLTLVSFGGERPAIRRALLVGIALNPIAIILVCQHGNSDVQVGLFVTLAVAALGGYRRSRDLVLWLWGCLFLGLGALAKTAPLVLAPLLAPGGRVASWAGRGLGATLFLGPAALGIGVILALAPGAVWDHVLGYRSTRGFFGMSGILSELGSGLVPTALVVMAGAVALATLGLLGLRSWRSSRSPKAHLVLVALTALVVVTYVAYAVIARLTDVDVVGGYDRAFTLAVVVLVGALAYRYWGLEPLAPSHLLLFVAVICMTVVAFGPGYGAHYAYWFLPALVGTYVLLDATWRRLLLLLYCVAAVTYGVEYGVVDFLGAWAVAMFGSTAWLEDLGEYLAAPQRWVVFRLPLFAAYLVVIAAGIERLARREEPAPA